MDMVILLAWLACLPVSNVAITLGYEGADFDATRSGSLNSNGFNLWRGLPVLNRIIR